MKELIPRLGWSGVAVLLALMVAACAPKHRAQQPDGSINCSCDDPTSQIDARDPSRAHFRCSDAKR